MNDDYSKMLGRLGRRERLAWMAFDLDRDRDRQVPMQGRSRAFWAAARLAYDLLDPDLDWPGRSDDDAENLHRLQS